MLHYRTITAADDAPGGGLAREAGYAQLYLETHSNLTTAMRLYEKLGFQEIEKPSTVLHGTMDHFYRKRVSR